MRTLYLRDVNGHPIAVLATTIVPSIQTESSLKEITFALATCNPLDRFNKEHGKALAIGRLVTAPLGAITISPSGQTKKNMLIWLINNHRVPQRSREAARRLLAAISYKEAVALEAQGKAVSQSRGPKVVDPPPKAPGKLSGAGGTPMPLDGKQCNCLPGRNISGLKWHSIDTPGCISGQKVAQSQADGHVEADIDRFHDEGGANHVQAH